MASTPQPMPMSAPPAVMRPAMKWLACWAEPHWQSTVVAAVVNGRPWLSHALRVTLEPCSPAWVTQPPTTSSTSAGSMPARFTSSSWAAPRICAGCRPDSHPARFPMGVRTASTMTASGIALSWLLGVAADDEAAGGDAGAGGDQHVLDVGDLVVRRAADLAHGLGDAVHAVDVRLAELAAVGVEGEAATQLDVAAGHEVLGLTPTAEAELLQLHEHERREVVVDDGRLDVGRAEARLLPQLPAHETHLGQARHLRSEERRVGKECRTPCAR